VSPQSAAHAVVKAKEYMDYEVKNLSGDDLGEVKDLAVDLNSGRILYAVIEHGGLATIDKLIAVPTSKLSPGADDDELVLNATDEELDRIKGFSDDSWPSATDDRVSPRTGQVDISGYR
jgi:sporulation protein YlmC with PRC-barrel domain